MNKNTRANYILEVLNQQFSPLYIELIDESFKHQVPQGAESHFKLTLVSENFSGISRVQRHQMINKALLLEFKKGLRALSLSLYSPKEWSQQPIIMESPLCHRKKVK